MKELKFIPISSGDDIVFDNVDARILSYHLDYKMIGRLSNMISNEDVYKEITLQWVFYYLNRNGFNLDTTKEYLILQKL